MAIMLSLDQKSPRGRLLIILIYLALILGGITMMYPFMVMITGSLSSPFDYERRSPVPRYLFSREDRFLHMLCAFFPQQQRRAFDQIRSYFPDFPSDWQMWAVVGDEQEQADAWVRAQLHDWDHPETRQQLTTMARDYQDFMAIAPTEECIHAYNTRYIAPFLKQRHNSLERFNAAWELSLSDFSKVTALEWSNEPWDMPRYVPPVSELYPADIRHRYQDLLAFRQAYRENRFSPVFASKDAPANYLRPMSLRFTWEQHLAKVTNQPLADICGNVPFPVPADAPATLQEPWVEYLKTTFPMRYIAIKVTPERQQAFERVLQSRFPSISYANTLFKTQAQRWSDIRLTETIPADPLGGVWIDFVRAQIPVSEWNIRANLADIAFQQFALQRHGSLAAVNEAYGTQYASPEEIGIPYRAAMLMTFAHREWPFILTEAAGNYSVVVDYLLHRGNAVRNTIILVALTLIITLLVNPLAAYALSRYQLRATDQVILFCLLTMAFPFAVSQIPGFLLLRDIGMLNTFWALVLPGAANGMAIFLLKGFFDSLPQELYEAAALDGAPEWIVFWRITLPLVKPILAVQMLNAFILAYTGWEWALVTCQDPQMWTIAVWTYQFSQIPTAASQPFAVMAAYVVTSIPVLIVFLLCQRVILRGIVLPQMK